MLLRALRALTLGAVIFGLTWAASHYSRTAAMLTLAVLLFASGWALIWLPRAAHRKFGAGNFARAALYYRLLRLVRFGRKTRRALDVSLAACALGCEDPDKALMILERIDPEGLGEAVRAAWLNNHAYALVRGDRDARKALEDINQAILLRPDVSGFRHTRGAALLAVGRVDEAIRELDSLWQDLAGDDVSPLLEAERCYDLALAWRRKGEIDYAIDYFERARRAAPESRWAERALEYLPAIRSTPAIAEFLEA